jgi:hypothetical protein
MAAKTKLDPKAFAYASAALCGLATGALGLANLSSPDYGREVLMLLASLYPGYDGAPQLESVVVLAGYALVKGAAVGWLFAWLHNRLIK